jgi:hypothetical protein
LLLVRFHGQGELPVSRPSPPDWPLRAPTADGALVAEPALAEVGRLLEINRWRLRRPGVDILGRSWDDLRDEARLSAVAAARDYMRSFGEPIPDAAYEHLLLAGHQPELFHPGVWIKNFALHGLASRHRLTAINLIVDNDIVKSTALRLPHPATPEQPWPYAARVLFDRWTSEAPYEERPIAEMSLFQRFADEALAILKPWPMQPLLGDFWEEVQRWTERTPLLGACFAGARRTFERQWGCHNLELPVSILCQTEPFAWFACHLLSELPRFHAVYNECVHDYRRAHGIRSRNHPVPDLARDGEWLETPFWGWRSGQSRRGRLFARLVQHRLELRAGMETWPSLSALTASAWKDLERGGYKIRSRALTNTTYARLFLGDLFIHGIGGGKYDELTDAILRRFYNCEPPEYLVLTGTRLLPLPALPATPEDRRRLIREVRDVHYNPQRYLDESELVREKQAWIARNPQTAAGRRERFEAFRRLTVELRKPLKQRECQLRAELAQCERQLAANCVLRRRDYAFCLYPEPVLRPFVSQLL